jgi:molybdate transport system substrate-binding protein
MKKIINFIIIMCVVISIVGCSSKESDELNTESKKPETTILVAAAASLKNCMDDELIPLFTQQHPNIKVNATYDSSGKLQMQIEEGAEVDVFMSASMKQMNSLNEKGMISENSIVELLENKIVLIVPKGSKMDMTAFEDILQANTIAIGDPESVPAGQYAKEAFDNLKIWDQVSARTSLGTNVTEVLNWVAEGSADAGVVYSTDAASNENVVIMAEAPEGSVSKVIYPIGIVKSSKNQEAAKLFTDFLQSYEALKIFESYGFAPNK